MTSSILFAGPSATKAPKVRLRTAEASSYLIETHGLPVAPATLNKLRVVGGGPAFQRFGRAILYHCDALDAWALAKLGQPLQSTSDQGGAA
jgi:hypothetical protein